MEQQGKWMIVGGLTVAALGAVFFALGRWFPHLQLGRLPGDIVIEKSESSLYIPVATMLLLSVILSLIAWIAGALRR